MNNWYLIAAVTVGLVLGFYMGWQSLMRTVVRAVWSDVLAHEAGEELLNDMVAQFIREAAVTTDSIRAKMMASSVGRELLDDPHYQAALQAQEKDDDTSGILQ